MKELANSVWDTFKERINNAYLGYFFISYTVLNYQQLFRLWFADIDEKGNSVPFGARLDTYIASDSSNCLPFIFAFVLPIVLAAVNSLIDFGIDKIKGFAQKRKLSYNDGYVERKEHYSKLGELEELHIKFINLQGTNRSLTTAAQAKENEVKQLKEQYQTALDSEIAKLEPLQLQIKNQQQAIDIEKAEVEKLTKTLDKIGNSLLSDNNKARASSIQSIINQSPDNTVTFDRKFITHEMKSIYQENLNLAQLIENELESPRRFSTRKREFQHNNIFMFEESRNPPPARG